MVGIIVSVLPYWLDGLDVLGWCCGGAPRGLGSVAAYPSNVVRGAPASDAGGLFPLHG
jgi:hypothetical protein